VREAIANKSEFALLDILLDWVEQPAKDSRVSSCGIKRLENIFPNTHNPSLLLRKCLARRLFYAACDWIGMEAFEFGNLTLL
jgi:hypothetical protein